MPTPINFRAITATDLDAKGDPSLAELNNKMKEMVDNINSLMGVNGPIKLLNHLDLGGNRIQNVGAAVSPSDVLTTVAADPIYGVAAQQQNMEAVGTKMLQTTRRLNDGQQQHGISSDLKLQGSLPPTFSGQLAYASTTTTITWSWTGLTITFADQSVIAVVDGSLLVTGLTPSTTYLFYPYYDTQLGVIIFVADSVNATGAPPVAFAAANGAASIFQHSDGHVPLSNGGAQGATTASGGGGGFGGGGGGTCIFGGMYVRSRTRNIISLREVCVDEQILSRSKTWTTVTKKRTGVERSWVRIALSNRESIIVTPTDITPLFDGSTKQAGALCLQDILRGAGVAVDEVPLQITELSPVSMAADWVSLRCDPCHEFLIGSMLPSVFAHNTVVKP